MFQNPFKGYCFPKDIIKCSIYMKLKFALSYRDIEELCEMRGVSVDHATVHRWTINFSSLIEQNFRKKKKQVFGSWRMDETYIKVNGKWCYLYRAVDKYGDTIDFCLKEKRDKLAALFFFRKAIRNNDKPHKVIIDKSGSNTYALKDINQEYKDKNIENIEIIQKKYLNNIVESDHRFIKKITNRMLGFKSFYCAEKTLAGIEVVHMIRKNQMNSEGNTDYEQFASLIS